MIRYTAGMKYQLTDDYTTDTKLRGFGLIDTRYIALQPHGRLLIRAGYAWDGPSGPTIDTQDFMRASLVHDALYQLMREGHLPAHCRREADRMLRLLCREDGMPVIRAWLVWLAVRLFGAPSARLRIAAANGEME